MYWLSARTLAKQPELKAEGLLGLGRVYTEMGEYDIALDTLYLARKTYPHGATGIAIERALGDGPCL